MFNRIFLFIPEWDSLCVVLSLKSNKKTETKTLFSYCSFVTRTQQAKAADPGGASRQMEGSSAGKKTAKGSQISPSGGWRRDGYVSASSASAKPRARASSGVKPLLSVRLTAGREDGSRQRHSDKPITVFNAKGRYL